MYRHAQAAREHACDPLRYDQVRWDGSPHRAEARADEAVTQTLLVRDIFGNPFRPVTVAPSWLTSTVVQLATSIYEHRAFDRLPVLADALEEAGCDNEDVLAHCRSGGVHVRGCWVVDQVLGKSLDGSEPLAGHGGGR